MKNLIAIIMIISICTPAHAAQKIKDMSMTPEQTNELIRNPPVRQQNNNIDNSTSGGIGGVNSGTGFDDNVPLDPNMARQLRDINTRSDNSTGQIGDFLGNAGDLGAQSINTGKLPVKIPPAPHRGNGQSYITEYCGSSYVAKNIGTVAMQACQDSQRQQSCERFTRASVTAQRVLSQAIDCELNAAGFNASGCDGLDASRLDLLKQSWQDEDLSYTILFLPDMILNSASNCASKR